MISAKVSGGEIAKRRLGQFVGTVKTIGDSQVRVGVPSNLAYPNGTPVILVASVHEFGVPGKVPERPFLRKSITEGSESLNKVNASNLKAVFNQKMQATVGLERLGIKASGLVQQFIRAGNFQSLSPETVKAKGSSKALIDTGLLIQSITHEVVGK
ncbi:MAG: hypothetical protein V4536_08815 [Pseudomonadota bacterium]